MEKQRSQKWMASAYEKPTRPSFCLRHDAAAAGNLVRTTRILGNPRQNSGDPHLSRMVAATVVASWLPPSPRARALRRVSSLSVRHSVL